MVASLLVVVTWLVLAIPPVPATRVNDYVGLLTPVERGQLEETLIRGEQQTRAQMVVAIFGSLQGENLEDYSRQLAKAWRVGREGVNDGVVLVIFMKERKMRLAVGDGLKQAIPDAAASDILATVVASRFRTGEYLLGLQEATRTIFRRIQATQRLRGEHSPSQVGTACLSAVSDICPS